MDINNRCRGRDGKCGCRMPLPESHGRHCPVCGTRVLTWEEMQSGPEAAPSCPKCGEVAEATSAYCKACGQTLRPTAPDAHAMQQWVDIDAALLELSSPNATREGPVIDAARARWPGEVDRRIADWHRFARLCADRGVPSRMVAESADASSDAFLDRYLD